MFERRTSNLSSLAAEANSTRLEPQSTHLRRLVVRLSVHLLGRATELSAASATQRRFVAWPHLLQSTLAASPRRRGQGEPSIEGSVRARFDSRLEPRASSSLPVASVRASRRSLSTLGVRFRVSRRRTVQRWCRSSLAAMCESRRNRKCTKSPQRNPYRACH